MKISNKEILNHVFLKGMVRDNYFPPFLVDKLEAIFFDMCQKIEDSKPEFDRGLFEITHSSVEKINELAKEFENHGSEIETVARDSIGEDFEFITVAYGVDHVNIEDAISPREW